MHRAVLDADGTFGSTQAKIAIHSDFLGRMQFNPHRFYGAGLNTFSTADAFFLVDEFGITGDIYLSRIVLLGTSVVALCRFTMQTRVQRVIVREGIPNEF